MTKEGAFEEYKKQTGYGDLSAVSAIAAHGAGFDSRNEEAAELKARIIVLEGELRVVLSAIPEGWEVPLLYPYVAAQARKRLENKP